MTKLTLADVNQALNHQITEGSEYQWKCFGPNARFLDYTIMGLDVTAGVIHDTQTQEIYEATLCNGPLVQNSLQFIYCIVIKAVVPAVKMLKIVNQH